MFVISNRCGRPGNRLIGNAHFIAMACEYGGQIANPVMSDYSHLFPSIAHDLWCRFPEQPAREKTPPRWLGEWVAKSVYLSTKSMWLCGLRKFPFRVLRYSADEVCDLAGETFRQAAQQNKTVFAIGWMYRCSELVEKHADRIRHHFRIGEPHRSNVDRCIDEARDGVDRLIGVHIRRGDYATYRGGEYFYSLSDYAHAMRQVAEQLGHQRTRFLICSEEDLNPADFPGLDVLAGPGHFLEDLYALAETDFIFGPPSTFSTWAAFYGDKPLHFMVTADAAPEMHQFPSLLSENAA